MEVAIFIMLLVPLAIFAVKLWNSLNTLAEPIESADATLDASLENKRALGVQLLALADTVAVNEYSTHRAMVEALKETAQAVVATKTPTAVVAQLASQFPTLQSYNAFTAVQNASLNVEQRVEAALSARNNLATAYNIEVSRFPNNIMAALLGRARMEYRTSAIALTLTTKEMLLSDPPLPPNAGPNRLAAQRRLEQWRRSI